MVQIKVLIVLISLFTFTSCSSFLASSGPSGGEVKNADDSSRLPGIRIVDVDEQVAKKIIAKQKRELFSESFKDQAPSELLVGKGDVLQITVWESPPYSLVSKDENYLALPEQDVSQRGDVNVPFIGRVVVEGKNIHQVEKELSQKLRTKANEPQVLVRILKNNSSKVIVVGDVVKSIQVPISAKRERVLDAIAQAGGVKQLVSRTSLQLTRANKAATMSLDSIIKDPSQNIFLLPGDIITSVYQNLSFTVLGASGKNEEVMFEAQGISLAQAIARSGGFDDNRADSMGLFLFRFEPAELTENGDGQEKVPVVYTIDFKDPAMFFIAQKFLIKDKDVIYISNSGQAQLQKFLNLLQSTAFSALGVAGTQNTLSN